MRTNNKQIETLMIYQDVDFWWDVLSQFWFLEHHLIWNLSSVEFKFCLDKKSFANHMKIRGGLQSGWFLARFFP